MKVIAKVPIYAEGEHTRFAPGTAEKMIGQTTTDGGEVIDANLVSPYQIMLTVKLDIQDERVLNNLRINAVSIDTESINPHTSVEIKEDDSGNKL